jgi:membrane-associated HD superfamily phosphohydrolase
VKLFRAIFANSTVNLKNVSLNEEFPKVEGTGIKIDLALEQEEIVKISLYVTSYLMFSIAQSVFSILHHLSIVRNENRSFKYIRFAPFINCIVVILAYDKLHERSIINNSNKKRSCAKKMFSSSFLLKIKINKGLLKVNQSLSLLFGTFCFSFILFFIFFK